MLLSSLIAVLTSAVDACLTMLRNASLSRFQQPSLDCIACLLFNFERA